MHEHIQYFSEDIGLIASIFILAVSLSIDAFSVGVSYGLRKIKIPKTSLCIISILSVSYSTIAMLLGKNLHTLLPNMLSKQFGIAVLIFMGIFLIIKALKHNKCRCANPIGTTTTNCNCRKPVCCETGCTLLKIAIRSLGITIQVIKNPFESDIDLSGSIDFYESLILGLALSIDAIGTGVGSALTGLSSAYLPVIIGFTQLVMLNIGVCLGTKINNIYILNEKVLSILTGVLLIILGLMRI